MARQHPSRLGLIVALLLVVLAAWACSAIYHWIRVGPTIKPGLSGPASTTPAASPTRITRGGATPVPGYATTWSSNSEGGAINGQTGYADWLRGTGYGYARFVQGQTQDLTVTPGGLVVEANIFDEGHRWWGTYQNGRVVGMLQPNCDPQQESSLNGGWAVANNGTYIWAAQYDTDSGGPTPHSNLIKRFDMNGNAAAFSGGQGPCSNRLTVDTGIMDRIWGLAASSTELYIADGFTNSVKVYAAKTMAYKRGFSFTGPRRIAYDPESNTLWISQGSGVSFAGNIYHYDINGNPLSGTITDVAQPGALQIHNNKLWVADRGPDQQIKIYNTDGTHSTPYTFGVQGGMYSSAEGGAGVWAADKLHMPQGLGFDSAGNLYVSGGGITMGISGNNDLRAFNSSGTLLWHLESHQWLDGGVIDSATDGQDVYTQYGHDKMDYNQLTLGAGNGGHEWSYYGMTLDPFTYPYDYRLGHGYNVPHSIQTIDGNKYLAMSDFWSNYLALYHIVNGTIGKPMMVVGGSGTNYPGAPNGSWTWFDSNNNGQPDAGEYSAFNAGGYLNSWNFDSHGDIWYVNANAQSGLHRLPMTGINGNGQLTYGAKVDYGIPAPFNSVQYVRYIPETDTMYLGGYTPAYPFVLPDTQGLLSAGSVVVRYDNWLAGNRTAAWTTAIPYSPQKYGCSGSTCNGDIIRSFDVAGDRIFGILMETLGTQLNGTIGPHAFWGPMAHSIYVYDTNTGAFLGEMTPGPESQYLGWQDQNNSLHAFQRSTGEYVVTEEEQVGQHITMLRGMLKNFTQY